MSSQNSSRSSGSAGNRSSLWDVLNRGAELYAEAVEDQMKVWQNAADRVGNRGYGPADAVVDTQRAAAAATAFGFKASQLWFEAMTAGMLDMTLWRRPGTCAPDPEKELQAIQRQFEGAMAAVAARDAKKTASYYSQGVRADLEFYQTIEGHEAWEAYWHALYSGWTELDLTYSKQGRVLSDDCTMAFEWGTMELTGQPPAGQGMPVRNWKGRYLVIWQKIDGEWLMTYDIQNSAELPPAGIDMELITKAETAAIQSRFEAAQESVKARRKSPERTASFYSDDVCAALEYRPTLEGKEPFTHFWKEVFGYQDFELDYEVVDRKLSNDCSMAYEYGTMVMSGKPPEGPALKDWQGRYLVIWQKDADGQWVMTLDIQNSLAPPPAGFDMGDTKKAAKGSTIKITKGGAKK